MITKEQSKRMVEVAQAMMDGKLVTVWDECGVEIDAVKYGYGIHASSRYTIHEPAPAKKYRAFKSAEEFKPHRNCWVNWPMMFGVEFMRVDRYDCSGVVVADHWLSFQRAFDLIVFDDNSPFGVSE
jgi:hypothetical protein